MSGIDPNITVADIAKFCLDLIKELNDLEEGEQFKANAGTIAALVCVTSKCFGKDPIKELLHLMK